MGLPKMPLVFEPHVDEVDLVLNRDGYELKREEVEALNKMPELLRDFARHVLERPKRQEQGDVMPQTFESWAADLIVLAKDARELLGEE